MVRFLNNLIIQNFGAFLFLKTTNFTNNLIFSNSEWWYVRHPKNGVGYAPRNFIARMESLESEE